MSSKEDKEDRVKEKLAEIIEESEPDKKGSETSDMLGISELGKKLIEEEKIKFLSNISDSTVNNFSILYALNVELNSDLLKSYLDHCLMLRISVKGAGRKDLVELTKNMSLAMAIMAGSSTDGLTQKTGFLNKLREKIQ